MVVILLRMNSHIIYKALGNLASDQAPSFIFLSKCLQKNIVCMDTFLYWFDNFGIKQSSLESQILPTTSQSLWPKVTCVKRKIFV